MSSWRLHFNFHLIPRGSERHIEVAPGADRIIANADLAPCWRGYDAFDFASVFEPALPRAASTSMMIRQWGTDERILVQVARLDGALSVYARAHIVGCELEDVRPFAKALRGNQLVLVLSDLRVIEASEEAMMMEIKDLSAARFLEDPDEFLRDLAELE